MHNIRTVRRNYISLVGKQETHSEKIRRLALRNRYNSLRGTSDKIRFLIDLYAKREYSSELKTCQTVKKSQEVISDLSMVFLKLRNVK